VGQGQWIDLFTHLWIDGYLEQRGLPHIPKEERVRELAKEVGREKAKRVATAWWGKPMTLRDAVRLGLGAGLTIEPECPIAIWCRETNRKGQT
jgi:hypothetical protein